MREPLFACRPLAQIEKAVAGVLPPVFGQKHAFGAVIYVFQRKAAAVEGGGEVVGVIGERGSRGGPDKFRVMICAGDAGAGAGDIGLQVPLLVGEIAVVEIRPVAEDGDPEPGDVRQGRGERLPFESSDLEAHAETCLIQSARL